MNKYLFLDIYNGESYSDSYAKLIKSKKIDFVIINGENAGDKGVGITKKIFDEFFMSEKKLTSPFMLIIILVNMIPAICYVEMVPVGQIGCKTIHKNIL